MKRAFKAFISSSLTYVLSFALLGAASVVAGIATILGAGPALIVAGAFMLGAAYIVVKGMKPNG